MFSWGSFILGILFSIGVAVFIEWYREQEEKKRAGRKGQEKTDEEFWLEHWEKYVKPTNDRNDERWWKQFYENMDR